MNDFIKTQLIYFGYYFTIQFNQIFIYWIIGIIIGSVISVFAKDKIHNMFIKIKDKDFGILGIFIASILGVASPLCMYGTIPIAASFSKNGMEDDWLAAFMMSSILLNPQLLIYSAALGSTAMLIRLNMSFLGGVFAGVLVKIFYKNKRFFNFKGFEERKSRDTNPNIFIRLLENIGRNIKATGLYFLFGIVITVLFQMYIPQEGFASLFSNKGFGVLMAATLGVPVYVCGGGTIPLLLQWLNSGMSLGAGTAFMITGPGTKITNLGALKIVLGIKNFIIYIAYVMVFALASGLVVDLIGLTI